MMVAWPFQRSQKPSCVEESDSNGSDILCINKKAWTTLEDRFIYLDEEWLVSESLARRL